MTTNIYWSPWYQAEEPYDDHFLTHYPLEKVYPDLLKNKNPRNVVDNFFNCHAFKSFCKNMYMVRAPYDVNWRFLPDPNGGGRVESINPNPNIIDNSFIASIKQPSVNGSLTINYSCNWIFFADKPVQIQTFAPWMHDPEIYKTSYYVPGMYDISQWFRPFELALQMKPGQTTLKSYEGEPVVYVKFHTDEPIKVNKFYLTQSLINHSKSCMNLKRFKKFRNLKNLYQVFNNSFLRNRILKEIQENVIED